MRLIEATVPCDCLSEVENALDESEYDYFTITEESSDYAALIHIPIPEEEVESVLGMLYESGLGSEDHVVILDAEVDIFERTDGTAEADDEHQRVAAAELEGKTEDLIPDNRTFATMMVLSTIVAATGLILNSAAVVVGSMVIAPLFGPAISASVGTVIDKSDLFRRGIVLQTKGVLIAIVSATIFSWILKTAYLTPSGFAVTAAPQIAARLSPDLLSLVVALVAGIAGVLSIATGAGMALVGVMMAAALLPPAATVGIGIAWQQPMVAIQSGTLLMVNVLAINFAGLFTLWYLGYRPQSWVQIPGTRRAILRRGGALFVAILVVSGFLWSVTYASVQQSQIEDSVEESVGERLNAAKYDAVSLLDVKVVQNQRMLTHEIQEVIVTIARPPGERYPSLNRNISRDVDEQIGKDVDVDIQVSLIVSGAGETQDVERQNATATTSDTENATTSDTENATATTSDRVSGTASPSDPESETDGTPDLTRGIAAPSDRGLQVAPRGG